MSNTENNNIRSERSQRVFVGLSGGVDSAVSAALLKKEGYDVTGVFIKAWTPEGYPCTWKEDRRSAMRAAAVLDIPFVTLDLEKEYKEGVVDYMIDEYKKGRTPNPDVMCNKEVKFRAFLDWALSQGADYVATGHYAQIEKRVTSIVTRGKKGAPNLSSEPRTPHFVLRESADKSKDQSYFLWTLTQEQLNHTLFPVGHLQKEHVRKLAKKFGLPQAVRKDSQGLCFLGQVDMKEFLSRYIPLKKGDVLNEKGEVIGYHSGAVFFTIGERHGFTVTKKTAEDKAFYVIAKDMERNTITISTKLTNNPKDLSYSESKLEKVNWIDGTMPQNKKLQCRLRYRQIKIPCEVITNRNEVQVLIKENTYISPGQSLVLYDGGTCLGGGIMR
jgi:tRNA-specific 2-thiouridylase